MAVFNLGVMCENGTGMTADVAKAAQLYKAAADAGLAAAQYNLGVLAAEGRGVPKDLALARRLFEKAAAQQHPVAKENLRRMDATEADTGKAPRLKPQTTVESGGLGAAAQGKASAKAPGQGAPKAKK